MVIPFPFGTCAVCDCGIDSLSSRGELRTICHDPDCRRAVLTYGNRIRAARAERRGCPDTRRCPRCKQRKPLNAEHFRPGNRTGPPSLRWSRYCRPCDRLNDRERRARKRQAREAAERAAARQLHLRIPSAPLAAAINRVIVRESTHGTDYGDDDSTRVRVCERAGIPDRTEYAWRTGERPSAQFDAADRVLTRLEILWWEAYAPDVTAGLWHPRRAVDVLRAIDAAERAHLVWEGE